jgi:hypothetical protein
MWDMDTVLTCVHDWGLPWDLDTRCLALKLAFLNAVFCAWRVADLALLRVNPCYLQRSLDSVVFQPSFRAKQDRPGHQNPLVILKAYIDKLCPVALLDKYLLCI